MKKKSFTNTIISCLFLVIMLGALCDTAAQQKNGNKTNSFDSIYPLALRGEIDQVLNILKSIDEDSLDESQKKLKDKYFQRFSRQTEHFSYNTENILIREFVDLYHNYWKSVMLKEVDVATADSIFKADAARFLFFNYYYDRYPERGRTYPIEISNNIYQYGNHFLEEQGFYSNAFGKTGHLYDLFLWKENEVHNYKVNLINNSVDVEVHFMKDFISTGWAHYSTFGRSYSGGWATKKALYVVEKAYEIESEWFEVSYLAHEAQHFSDYKYYPNLKQPDLEYRAKLVELNKSESTIYGILGRFIRNAANQKSNAHAYANYILIRRLSEKLFDHSFQEDIEDWKEVSPGVIKKATLELYENHTEQLEKAGSKSVIELITKNQSDIDNFNN